VETWRRAIDHNIQFVWLQTQQHAPHQLLDVIVSSMITLYPLLSYKIKNDGQNTVASKHLTKIFIQHKMVATNNKKQKLNYVLTNEHLYNQ